MSSRSGNFPIWISRYVGEYLDRECRMSEKTIQSYAQSWMLMLRFLEEVHGRQAECLSLTDFDAKLVLEFLDWFEAGNGSKRGRPCSPRSRNLRLAGIKSFFSFVAVHDLSIAAIASSIGKIRGKRFDRAVVDYLMPAETGAVLDVIDADSLHGVRNRAMIVLCLGGGLRVAELLALTMDDLHFDVEPFYRVCGKGRRQRDIPMSTEAVRVLNAWLDIRGRNRGGYVFEGRERGLPFSRDGFAYVLKQYVRAAEPTCPTLASKNVTPHVLRHSYAMRVLRTTRDVRKVSLALGHASPASTEIYLHADPDVKAEILAQHGEFGIELGDFSKRRAGIAALMIAAARRNPERLV